MFSEFASSPTRLVQFFRKSRDAWKARSHKYQERLRQLDGKIRDLTRSRDKWKSDAKMYRQEVANQLGQRKERLPQTADSEGGSCTSNAEPVDPSLPTSAHAELVPIGPDAALAAPPFCPSPTIPSR